MHFGSTLLCLLSFPLLLISEKVKQCDNLSHTIREDGCEWNCLTLFGLSLRKMVPICLLDGTSLLRCQGDADCADADLSSSLRFETCQKVLCSPVNTCTNGTEWLAKYFGVCIGDFDPLVATGIETTPSLPDGNKKKKKRQSEDTVSSWKCWSIIWAMGTFAVACFVLQCAAFNMYKARRKRITARNDAPVTEGERVDALFAGQPQVLPSAPPLIHVSQPSEALQPQVVYVSDRPPAYEVVLQLSDHPPPYSSL